MATLTGGELAALRNRLERVETSIPYTKGVINAALQAIEDAMRTQNIPQAAVGATIPQYIGGRIDAATSPFVFTNVQKRRLFAYWCELTFGKDQ